MGWMDTVSALEGLRVQSGAYELRLDETGNVQGVATVEGQALAGRAAVVFALSPGVAVTHVEVDGVGAAARVDDRRDAAQAPALRRGDEPIS